MKHASSVLIALVNWNHYEDTIECLSSLSNVDYPLYDIVVVDNGSTNESVQKIKEAFPRVNIIETGKNLGFAGGNNVAIQEMIKKNRDYVLLLNNDTVVDPSFLSILTDAAENDEHLGIVGPVIYYFSDRQKLWWAGGHFDFWMNFRPHVTLPCRLLPVQFITGCAMLIKRSVVNAVGLMDERFSLYYEDADYCLQAKRKGFGCAVVPAAKIWHKISVSTKGSENPRNEYYYVRNKMYMVQNNCGFIAQLLFFTLYPIKIFLKSIGRRVGSSADYSWRGYSDFWRKQWGKLTD